MTKTEFSRAVTLAQSRRNQPWGDCDCLIGCALPEFESVHCTISAVAELIRWQCTYMFGSTDFDSDELANIANIARRKFMIVGDGADDCAAAESAVAS